MRSIHLSKFLLTDCSRFKYGDTCHDPVICVQNAEDFSQQTSVRHTSVCSGRSQQHIAEALQISRRSVQYITKKERELHSVLDRARSGRPRLLTKRGERRLIITAKKAPTTTARRLQEQCGLANAVSLDTVKRRLRRYYLFGRIAVRKPRLTPKQINNRLQWCRQRLNWTATKWATVIFSDECKLEINPNRRMYVRRRVGDRLRARYVQPSVKNSPSVMVWGAIRGDSSRILVRCVGNVDSREYQRILDVGLPALYSHRCLFQQDGAPAHRSESTKAYLTAKQIRLLQSWPSQSPDLSVIENLWNLLKERVFLRQPKTVDQLWQIAEEEWNKIPNDAIRSLYQSIPRRIEATVAVRGGHTKY